MAPRVVGRSRRSKPAKMGRALPHVAVAPVAGEGAGGVEGYPGLEDVDRAVLVLGADEAVRRHGPGRPLPRPPAAGGVERGRLVGGAERPEVVGAADDAL